MTPGDTTQGRRVDPYGKHGLGDYSRDAEGDWWVRPPRGHLGKLVTHDVVEHEDGTITVSPSIVSAGGETIEESWHGYLERGVWREV